MPVTTQHREYTAHLDQWTRNRDACKGQKAVKDAGIRYLPGFEPEDKGRYESYKKRARFLNVTGRTKAALCGAVFRREPEVELPTVIEYLREDADGAGESITQISKKVIDDALQTGRYGLLVDYPTAPEGLTEEQVAELDLHARIACYRAESIINWRTVTVAGRQLLSMVVLEESAEEVNPEDPFQVSTQKQYRVLWLESGVYRQDLYDRHGKLLAEPTYPRDRDGNQWREIPFVFIGSEANQPSPSDAPLSDLADANISWYQVSADHMENLHIHGQVTLGISSPLSFEQFQEANPNGVMVGARAGHFLGEGGGFTTATAPESSSLSKALEDIKADMINIGARLVQPRTGQKTAEEARIDSASEMSVLETLVGNVSEGIEKAIEFVARFMGADDAEATFSLNREFWDQTPDAQVLATIMGLEDRGHMAPTDVRKYLRAVGLIHPDRTDEEIDAEASDDAGIPRLDL